MYVIIVIIVTLGCIIVISEFPLSHSPTGGVHTHTHTHTHIRMHSHKESDFKKPGVHRRLAGACLV